MSKEQTPQLSLQELAEKANGYSVFAKGSDKYIAFNEGFKAGYAAKGSDQVDWNKIRDKFFSECVIPVGVIMKVDLAPHDLFEWFKKAIVYSGSVGQQVGDGLLAKKLEFYREQTDKVRQLIFSRNDIGEPCQPLYDAIVDKITAQEKEIERLKSLTSPDTVSGDEANNYGFDYVCVAYRYGHREGHSYVVDICKGIDTAKEVAEKEVTERGGKYSVVVFAKNNGRNEIEEVYVANCPEHYTKGTRVPPVSGKEVEEGFKDYMINERNYFVKTITDYFPHEGYQRYGEGGNKIRVAAENMLICFDQMRERLLSTPPTVSGDAVEFVEWAIYNGWFKMPNDDMWSHTVGTRLTSQELYTLFHKSKKK